MKLATTTLMTLILFLFMGLHSEIFSQEKGNKNVTIEDRDLASFSGIDVSGSINLIIENGETTSVKIETDENLQDNVKSSISDNVLFLTIKGVKSPTKLKAYVVLSELEYLRASGATDVSGKALLEQFKTDEMKIVASGASSVDLNVNVQYLESKVSGAADLTLAGKAITHNLEVSGAGSIKARNLITSKSIYNVSGAADAMVNVTDEIIGEKSGAGTVKFIGEPKNTIETKQSTSKSSKYYTYTYPDSTKVKIGSLEIEVYEGDDSVKVVVGNRELHVDDDGNVRITRNKKKKFNGHWAGFDIGLNGYVNSDYNMKFTKEYEYMDLRMEKSAAVYINFFEQNVALAKNQKWGLVTGLGIHWNNYRWRNNTRLNPDSSYLIGYLDQGITQRKNKLTMLYLNVPLIFEFQTNNKHKKDSFHFGLGMIAGARLSSHTKKYYDEYNKEFDVTQYNPETGDYEVKYTAISPNTSKEKNFDDFHLQPFKFDATVRIGWGFINLFANFSVNEMFRKDKGPELYPWTAGITLVNF